MSSNPLSVADMNTRSDDVFKEFNYENKNVIFKRRAKLDYVNVIEHLPTYRYVIER